MGKPLMFAAFSLVQARAPPKKTRAKRAILLSENVPVTIMHKKVRLVNFAFRFFFFSPYLQDHGFLRSRNFATIAT